MKRLMTFMMMAAFAAMVACSSDTTEIGWRNNVGENINEIIWDADNIKWVRGDLGDSSSGYIDGETTEQKEVSTRISTIYAAYWDGAGYSSSTAILETGNSSYQINEGESVIVTINTIVGM